MADEPQKPEPQESEQDFGEFGPEETEVPVEDWVQHPVSDSSDYLDRPDPVYLDEATEEADAPDRP